MNRNRNRNLLIVVMMVLLFLHTGFAQVKDRANIPTQYKWNLADIYPGMQEWQKHKSTFAARFQKAASFKGTLKGSAGQLYRALEYIFQVQREFDKLWVYASMLSDQDTRKSKPMAMTNELRQMSTAFRSSRAYMLPEILSIPADRLTQFYKDEPKLEKYRRYIDGIQRMKAYTLSEAEEDLLAQTGLMSGAGGNVFNVFSNADMPYPRVTLSNGKTVTINVPTFARFRADRNRADREKIFHAFFSKLYSFRRTLGATLGSKIKENLFYTGARKYGSVLEMALYPGNVPTTVYTKLIENVHKYLPLLHRYLRIRKQLLGVDVLQYHDFYPDLVEGVTIEYNYEEAKEIMKKALAVLGDDYVKLLDRAFSNRWVDVYPNTGKASGAYCDGSYDTHPYVKVNYNDRFPDMSMLAHELGHAMHSFYSNKNQPYPDAGYSSFVAEVASTTNEALLTEYVIKTIKDPKKKLALLGSWIEGFRASLFRQTKFAEFELEANRIAERGEPLSGDTLNELYLRLLRKYYGHEEGVSMIKDTYASEWSMVPHFYIGFYTYQYATSYTAALALAEKMSSGGKDMVKKYMDFLSSGGSDDPIPTLKKLGIDMTTDEPFKLAMKKMESILDEMEALLKD